ncbi:MAG: hypothetical protein GXO10_05670 [Crenarchaeota archaeon]|nr:hypothetical protein [Thermoproteota archaeon]
MSNTNIAITIIKEIESCHRCSIVDKPYVKYSPYLKYLPEKINILVISESPPPGKKNDFIYNLSCRDRLRRVLAHTLEIEEEQVPSFLKKNNIFWTTAVKCRPLNKNLIEEMRRRCVRILRREIEILNPRIIVALGKIAWKSIDEISPSITIIKEYHPLYIWRFQKDRLLNIRNILTMRLVT